MNIKAIIFDAFGTLFDVGTGVSAKNTVISNIRSCGKSVDEKKFAEEWTAFYIENTSESGVFRTEREIFASRIEMFYSRYGVDRNAEADSDTIIRGAFERKAFPEVREVIESLRKKYKLFIASNTDNDVLYEVMTRNSISVDKIYTSENLKCYKPTPDFFGQILADSGLAPQEVLFVGDSVRDDVIGPKAVGIRSVLVCRNGVPENAGQAYTVTDLNGLWSVLTMSIDNMNYCIKCGRPLTYKAVGDEGGQRYCPACDKFYFDNPASCVLVAIINENGQVLLLKQNYITEKNYTLCSGYLKKGDTLEETVCREVLEETGQRVLSCEYVRSYYFAPKNLIMAGFIAYVKASGFGISNEVDELIWADFDKAVTMVERENNYSGIHLDNCIEKIKNKSLSL